ncbi:MAG TPA: PP2C family protein-serine/threonine phosphatase [Thermoanaerobaculia bacterium]|nr:PP2C family protein-serine/threonine phosphatase [Thermoanaerobaculia bacterium]
MSAVPAHVESRVKQLALFRAGRLKPAAPLDVHAISIPFTAFTGDFYSVHRADDRLWFALGDVAGKGLSAAIVMAMIQEELERTTCDDPAANMMRLHTFLRPVLTRNRFATAVIGFVRDDGTVVIANGGHCPPLIMRASGKVEQVTSTGPVIGVLSTSQWRTFQTTLAQGDALVLYTDGVIETRSQNGDEFGVQRLENALGGESAEQIARNVVNAVDGHGKREDDLTLLVIRR